MAEKKIHKQEKPNRAELTPQEKKAKAMRADGFSLSEIAAKLNIKRKEVEALVAAPVVTVAPVKPIVTDDTKSVYKPKKTKKGK